MIPFRGKSTTLSVILKSHVASHNACKTLGKEVEELRVSQPSFEDRLKVL